MKDAPYCHPLEKIKHTRRYFYIDDGCVHADMPFYPADVAEKTIRALDSEIFEQRRTINSLISQHQARRKQLRKERHDARDALKHLRVAYAELQAAIAECSDGFAFQFWKKALARLKESDDACKARKAVAQIVKAPATVETKSQYLILRTHMEWDGRHGNVWCYKCISPDVNKLIHNACFVLKPIGRNVTKFENNLPCQEFNPGCVFAGMTSETIRTEGRDLRSSTYVAIYNISRPEYSPGVLRETSNFDKHLIESCNYNEVLGAYNKYQRPNMPVYNIKAHEV